MLETVICQSCGNTNAASSRFCEHCGSPLKDASETPRTPPVSGPLTTFGTLASRINHPTARQVSSWFFVPRLLTKLDEGGIFRRITAVGLKVIAVLLAVSALIGWILTWTVIDELNALEILTLVGLQLVYPVVVYLPVHVIWYRATQIGELPVEDFPLTLIAKRVVRMVGEVLAAAVLGSSLIPAVPLILLGGQAGTLTRRFPLPIWQSLFWHAGGLLGGILVVLTGLIAAYIIVVVTYLLSDSISMIHRIATGVTAIRQGIEKEPAEIVPARENTEPGA